MHKFEQKISRNTNYTEKLQFEWQRLTIGELSLSFGGFCLIETDHFGLMGGFYLIEIDPFGLIDGFSL